MVSHIKEEYGLMALVGRVLTKILGPSRRQQGHRKDCIVTKFVIFHSDTRRMTRAVHVVRMGEKRNATEFWWGNVKKRDCLNMNA